MTEPQKPSKKMKKDAKKGTETHAYKRKLRRKSRIKVRKSLNFIHFTYFIS